MLEFFYYEIKFAKLNHRKMTSIQLFYDDSICFKPLRIV